MKLARVNIPLFFGYHNEKGGFDMNEKKELKIKNLVTKDGKVYKKDDMPTEIILSTEIEKI